MKKFSNASNLQYALELGEVNFCDRCWNEPGEWWEIYGTAREAAEKLDEQGWIYRDWDRIVCPDCSVGRRKAVPSYPLFDSIPQAQMFVQMANE